jgi:UDP-N-acetylmuramoyl-tripeptide--D-alanyl-D-alanine ligase
MIELLRGTPAQRRVAVLGEMLELGPEAGRLHREAGRFAAEQGIDVVIGVRGAARCIVEGAVEGGLARSNAIFFDSAEEAGRFLAAFLHAGDVALFKGSRGVAVEKALECVLNAAG